MRRADRLFQIVQYLRGGRLVTAANLAERLEVTTRTIYRDVADLMASGVPIEGEAGLGYVMRDGYDLPPLMFTNDEIVALVAGARMIKAWGGTGPPPGRSCCRLRDRHASDERRPTFPYRCGGTGDRGPSALEDRLCR